MRIPPGVFHPGIFFSTPVFLRFLEKNIDFTGQKTLDIGTGSGILGLWAAKHGALATGIDLNPAAVDCAKNNAVKNGLKLRVIESNLFNNLQQECFDIMLINPPWYARKAADRSEDAFFAGENFEYFDQLFQQMPHFCCEGAKVLMILSEDGAPEEVGKAAQRYGWAMENVYEEKRWGERFMIFSLKPTDAL